MQKNTLTGSALILAAVLAGGFAYAQDAGLTDMGKMGGGMGQMFDFATLDADKDGKVTKAEVDAFHAARVKEVDANADGKLSAEELANMQIKAMTARITDHAAKMVAKMDSDGDGLLSAAEMAVRPGPAMMFDKIDANNDGAITQAEADAAKQAMQDMRGKHGHHGKHGGQMGDMGGMGDMGQMGGMGDNAGQDN